MLSRFRLSLLAALAGALFAAPPLAAETLTVRAYAPAASDAALGLQAIAVERFSGIEGARFAMLVGDHLRSAQFEGSPWFTVLPASLGHEADAILDGHVQPQVFEQPFAQVRKVCWAEDGDGNCIERRNVEFDCLRLAVGVQPDLRLIAHDGALLWAAPPGQQAQLSFCPDLDPWPDVDLLVDRMLHDLAQEVRLQLAPVDQLRTVRIMEGRAGLQGEARESFRTAIRLTKHDEDAACDLFAELHAAHPQQPSLLFNAGLCAERRGELELAHRQYVAALPSKRSDDEASAGLRRIAAFVETERQVAIHYLR